MTFECVVRRVHDQVLCGRRVKWGGQCVTRSALTVASGRSSVTTAMAVATSVTSLSDPRPATVVMGRASNARTLGAAPTAAEIGMELHEEGFRMKTEYPCTHEFSRTYFEWEEMEVRDGRRSRPFWQVQECKKCGERRRESDRYYGEDMAVVHLKWTSRGQAL